MAKFKGLFPVVGTIGGVNFYYLNGELVARKAGGGFNGKAIKSKKSMQRVRENGHEFGQSSRVNKAFRMALRPFYKGYRFPFFHSRLMSLFTRLKDLDAVNPRGKRVVGEGVTDVNGLALLKTFIYTPDCDLARVLPFNYDVAAISYALTISGFDIKQVGFISGATHVELTYGVLDFDFTGLNSELYLATPVMLSKGFTGHSVVLSPFVTPTITGTRLSVMGVRFYQEVDGVMYVLNAKEGVGISVLYVES
ncbi:hypothetical protein [Formosa maritima]|uniref:Uncharacterized protein n=1 Tax=Formosa maritima TaxID=2592046 RepID=A0A5D0G2Q8_9FLAO|nr:hypothetical protein [Formosa maritima]TYA53118.1 hypothetical protein FVF61_10685 [Formosa maritima]